MNICRALAALLTVGGAAHAQTASEIISKTLEVDSFGLGDAEVQAHAIVRDARGAARELAFSGRSRRYESPLTKSIMRFSAPDDLKGVAFLQIQRKDADDDRYLYLPEMRRARRIAGSTRGNAFMGTDFSYADLDRRDLRESRATAKGDENVGRFACHKVELIPTGADPPYARLLLWVQKDNFVTLKLEMYNKAGVLLKTLSTQEVRKINGRWFIMRSTMKNHQESRSTELIIDKITSRQDIPDGEFTVRNLEKS
jgi:outer membrane lipoprotein-sorting protein